MNRFYVTFGQKYRRQPHPVLGDRPELPDGYLTVEADSYLAARQQAVELLDIYFSSIYQLDDSADALYPAGDLGTLQQAVEWAKALPHLLVVDTGQPVDANEWIKLRIEALLEDERAGIVHDHTEYRVLDALQKVLEAHPREEFDDAPGEFFCRSCQVPAGLWPCKTVQAITAALGIES